MEGAAPAFFQYSTTPPLPYSITPLRRLHLLRAALSPWMDIKAKAVITDMQSFDTEALKARLGALRRYL